MNVKKIGLVSMLLAGVLALSGLPAASQAAGSAPTGAAADKKEHVILHVDENDPKVWNLALNNVKNLQAALGKDKVDIEVVVYGPGINMLKLDSEVGNRVNDTIAAGVPVVACQNTMKGMKLTKDDMLPTIGYVPGGVVEIMKKQTEGWAYVKP
jgi:intracellular sulfur oxidation DsrE/DsrF family protein